MPHPVTVLTVDDDPRMRAVLQSILEGQCYSVTPAADGAEALALLARRTFHLITLDIGVPDFSGVDLVRAVCRSCDSPVIVVSGRDDVYDRVVALELGVDDYIAKPFNARELAARVNAVLRRSGALPGRRTDGPRSRSLVRFDRFVLDPACRKLTTRDGAQLSVTVAECRLIAFLAAHKGRVCSRDQITEGLKGRAWSPLDRTLDTLVARVRRKIEVEPSDPRILMSVRGIGYMMTD